MKWLVFAWLLAAGMGVSYSVIAERQRKVRFLKEMEHSLGKLAYYMYQWRMPIKEAICRMVQEEKGEFQRYYVEVRDALEERQAEDFGKLWQEKSKNLLKHAARVCDEGQMLWTEAFVNLPMDVEELNRRLLFRINDMKVYREALEKKYKGEQKLVFAMGIFVSTFFCLIFW